MAILHDNPRPTDEPGTDANASPSSSPSPPPTEQPEFPQRRFSYRAAYISMGVIGAALTFLLIRFTVDDAFITWRYGQSLMSGFWNWNPTPSDKVEAYSNTLYAALSVIPAAIGLPAELFFKLLGLALLGAYVVLVQALPVPRPQRLVLTGFAVVNPLFFVHLFAGLETASFALLLAALFGTLYANGRLGRAGHALAVAVALSRPEGMLFAVVAEAFWVRLTMRRRDAIVAGALVAGLLSYWFARAAYFGKFFPNPFYVKTAGQSTGIAAAVKILQGLEGMVLLLALVIAAAEGTRRWRARRRKDGTVRAPLHTPPSPLRDATPAVLAGTTALVVFTVYRISNLGMDFGNRFRWQLLFPIAVVLLCRPLPLRRDETAEPAGTSGAPSPRWAALAVFLGALTVLEGSATYATARNVAVAASIIACLGALAAWAWARPAAIVAGAIGLMVAASAVTTGELLGWSVYRYHIQDAHQAIGRAIAADPSMRGGTVAIGDSGVLPYSLAPDQSALDIGGLADPFAGKPAVPPAVLGDLVAVVALGGSQQPYDLWPGDSSATQTYDYMVARHFRFVPGVPYAPGYWLNLYLRPGHGSRLVADLDAIRAAAVAQNLLPDDQVLSGHLFDFPFLHG